MAENHIYDTEVYPNYVVWGFKNVRKQEYRYFEVGTAGRYSINDTPALVNYVREHCNYLVGYNSMDFDDPLLNLVFKNRERIGEIDPMVICTKIYQKANEIIERQQKTAFNYISENTEYFKSLDLIQMFNRIDRVSLKQLAINLRWHNVIDLPIPPGTELSYEQVKTIRSYLTNDLDMTELVMVKGVPEQIKSRVSFTKQSGIYAVSMNDTDVAKRIISDLYCKKTGISESALKKMRTYYKKIPLKNAMTPKVQLLTKDGQELMRKFRSTVLKPQNEGEKQSFEYQYYSKYAVHAIKLGGMHSVNRATSFHTDPNFVYIDLDVQSYYPRLMVYEQQAPKHLGLPFIGIYRDQIFFERLKALERGDTIAAKWLKIVANATYGLTLSEFSFMYDEMVGRYICISGQLFLIMLIEVLEKYSGCKVIYSNTDGLTVQVPRSDLSRFMSICNRWESYTNMKLEFNNYKNLYFRDVNSYLIEMESGKVKVKGAFSAQNSITKGYGNPVVAQALLNYYIDYVKPEDTILSTTDIYDFMMAERLNKDYLQLHHLRPDGTDVKLQKNNRWIITNGNPKEGVLRKVNTLENTNESVMKGYKATIMNSVPEGITVDNAHLNYDYYIGEALKIINAIKKIDTTQVSPITKITQGSLFT